MCTTCGCGQGDKAVVIDPNAPNEHHHHHHEHEHGHHHHHHHEHEHGHHHHHHHGHEHGHHHHHHHGHEHEHHHHDGEALEHRLLKIERDLLAENNAIATRVRLRLEELGIFALNLVSSPGAGKTTLLTKTIERLKERFPIWVIEGDQQTSNDAERIRRTGVPAIQINTGQGCHLEAYSVEEALDKLELQEGGFLFIENVGNLVCPAMFDLGEAHKVVILSVPEGEDKPAKYPQMFHESALMLINKIDLLPYLDFDVEKCIAYARQVQPDIETIRTSARTSEGLDEWIHWLLKNHPNHSKQTI